MGLSARRVLRDCGFESRLRHGFVSFSRECGVVLSIGLSVGLNTRAEEFY